MVDVSNLLDQDHLSQYGLGAATHDAYASDVTWKDLGVFPEIAQALEIIGAKTPFHSQKVIIPASYESEENVLAQFGTGTGKTIAFLVTSFMKVNPEEKSVQALILLPTQELAVQVYEVARIIAAAIHSADSTKTYTVGLCTSGEGHRLSEKELDELFSSHILVATVGSLLSRLDIPRHAGIGSLNKSTRGAALKKSIKLLIVDEVDKLLATDNGAERALVQDLFDDNQELRAIMCSATTSASVESEVNSIVGGKLRHVNNETAAIQERPLPQIAIVLKRREKTKCLVELLAELPDDFKKSVIIFTNSRKTADDLHNRMKDAHVKAVGCLHAGVDNRRATMADFRSGKTKFLITTDVAARGIDVVGTSLTINYDMPLATPIRGEDNKFDFTRDDERDAVPTEFRHRIGRAGRGGRIGAALTFISSARDFERYNTIMEDLSMDSTQIEDNDDLFDNVIDEIYNALEDNE